MVSISYLRNVTFAYVQFRYIFVLWGGVKNCAQISHIYGLSYEELYRIRHICKEPICDFFICAKLIATFHVICIIKSVKNRFE